jgi:hypothetical protein
VCAPLYFQARQPHFIDHEGSNTHDLERPVLPPDLAQLDAERKKKAQALFLQQSICALYRKIIHDECPEIFECLEFQESTAFTLLLLARNILVDGEASYMAQACELETIWETLPGARGVDFPLRFSEAELEIIEADLESAQIGMTAMQRLRMSLGGLYPEQGYVPLAQHKEAVDALSRLTNQVLSEVSERADNLDE